MTIFLFATANTLTLDNLTLPLEKMMERILEAWLRIRSLVLVHPQDSYHHVVTTLRRKVWNSMEWVVAWILIFGFSSWYLLEYSSLQLHRLRIKLSRSPSITNKDHILLPATCLEQTRTQIDPQQYWVRLWDEMETIFQQYHSESAEHEKLISHLRTNLRARHVATLLLCKEESSSNHKLRETDESIRTVLKTIWPRILTFPSERSPTIPPHATTRSTGFTKDFDISLIIPAFQVSLEDMKHLLQYTMDQCDSPQTIQIIVAEVVLGHSNHHDHNGAPVGPIGQGLVEGIRIGSPDNAGKGFGEVQVISYCGSRGRGGCLNHGARQASGRILTFLHADTFLPRHWDSSIRQALRPTTFNGKSAVTTTMCAFAMGIDMSPFQSGKVPIPVGLWGADYILGAIRCSLCKLPYGDSVLSIPTHIFEYLGGYPEQPLMEDFELVQLLRRRAALMVPEEQITILPDRIACSPRRWQSLGVAYVILANAYCIYRYRRLKTPSEDIYEFYYGSPPTRATETR